MIRHDQSGLRRMRVGAGALGFALGGFFDGIVLHQVLQWHHLLSALDDARWADPRAQILADGLFHAAMYVVGLAGIVVLVRARAALQAPGSGSRVLAYALIGFGAWHAVDAVLSHWVLGIHRIRMDSAVPLAWDIAWLAVFGIAFIAVGLRLLRRTAQVRAHANASSPTRLLTTVVVIAGATALAAALPWRSTDAPARVTVVLRPDARPARLLGSLERIDARVVWSDRAGEVWVLALPRRLDAWRLYREGAMYVGGAGSSAVCSARWTLPSPRP